MASKAILAIQSPIFRQMFYRNFREARKNCNSVTFSYSTEVLQAIVSYCYTTKIGFDWLPLLEKIELGLLSDNMAMPLVREREAANYFELPKLHESITKALLREEKGIDCYKIELVVMKELKDLGEDEGTLWSECFEIKDDLAYMAFCAEMIWAE